MTEPLSAWAVIGIAGTVGVVTVVVANLIMLLPPVRRMHERYCDWVWRRMDR